MQATQKHQARTSRHTESSERIAEIAQILAAGLMRLRARKSSEFSVHSGESSLDFSPLQSGHPAPETPENT